LTTFATNLFFETYLQTSISFAFSMASPHGPSFLTFNGKKYHPSLEWDEEEGLLQDPKTHAPHSKNDFMVNSFFVSLLANLLILCFVGGTLSFCCCMFLWEF